jgi:hypothetical protein
MGERVSPCKVVGLDPVRPTAERVDRGEREDRSTASGGAGEGGSGGGRPLHDASDRRTISGELCSGS